MSMKLNVKLITSKLADELILSMENANGIYIMTSFLMQSGVNLLAPHLKKALERGAEVKILSGDYLYITQPEGLKKLLSIDERLEARIWRSMGTSFHPKAYLFDYKNEKEGLLIVGSSNFSYSALKTGFEWNLAMNAQAEPYTFQFALDKFIETFYHESTLPLNNDSITLYENEYLENHRKNPELQRSIIESENSELATESPDEYAYPNSTVIEPNNAILPRPAQAAALAALERTIEEEYDKAMVVMATGLGKTYLAGFLAKGYKRVLFVAHREEILNQAARSFKHIMPERSFGIYNGLSKEKNAEVIFASIYTLSRKNHREQFKKNTFDLIIIDEFHHAAAKIYQSILDYFNPNFLLGITATPDRLDGKDIYGLCDGNVAYKIHFIEAIRKEWLSPFQYYGVYDETDYSKIRWLGTRYDEEQLLAAQIQLDHTQKIYETWLKHKQTRTIGFCSSIRQADFLANFFSEQGFNTLSLHSRTTAMSRQEAINKLDNAELDIIFTVDLFNEGTDIPKVDTLLFVRPTESLTIFTQQIGRGLRVAPGKTHCVIIDLIGNYKNADVKLQLFSDLNEDIKKKDKRSFIPDLPENCDILLDTHVVNLLNELSRKRLPFREKLYQDFLDLKQELGRIPTYLELHLLGKSFSKSYQSEFGSYLSFLNWAGLLTEKEKNAFNKYEAWINDVEKTTMTKSYKMIILLYMLQRGSNQWIDSITPEETAKFFHNYLTEKEYRKRIDFSDRESQNLWIWNEQTYAKLVKLIQEMPMSKWANAKGSQTKFQDNLFSLNFDILEEDKQLLYKWTEEICHYRLHVHFERRS